MTNYPITETLRQFIQGEKLCSLEPGILFMDEKREEQSPQLWQMKGVFSPKLGESEFYLKVVVERECRYARIEVNRWKVSFNPDVLTQSLEAYTSDGIPPEQKGFLESQVNSLEWI